MGMSLAEARAPVSRQAADSAFIAGDGHGVGDPRLLEHARREKLALVGLALMIGVLTMVSSDNFMLIWLLEVHRPTAPAPIARVVPSVRIAGTTFRVQGRAELALPSFRQLLRVC